MKQIPDDPTIRSMERTGYPPFMTECLNRFVPASERVEEPMTDKEAEAERAYERLRKRLEDET